MRYDRENHANARRLSPFFHKLSPNCSLGNCTLPSVCAPLAYCHGPGNNSWLMTSSPTNRFWKAIYDRQFGRRACGRAWDQTLALN